MSVPAKPVTILDVAKRAGVSAGTVSRVLNRANVPLDTRRRVSTAVSELGYVPNHAARSLKRRTTEQIALVIPDVGNPVYVQMAKSVQRVAAERGYRLSLISTENGVVDERQLLRGLHERQLDGMVLVSLRPGPSLLRQIREAAPRVCLIGSFPDDLPVDAVRVDSAHGVRQGVAHLLAGGRRRIAMVHGTRGTVPAETRARGYRDALLEAGVPFRPELSVDGDFTMGSGYRAVDALEGARPDAVFPDAVFCANDMMALGVMRRLRELGRDVPGDVAVVGMDDIDMAGMSAPTLTSVSLRAEERGRLATEMLLERLAHGGPLAPRVVHVLPALVVRESSTAHVVLAGGPS
ncbi:MAG: LacI family DNA-binding transcriptional regulator [Trueperaceae bacterium]|nr:LacI family DNA-binding transcriptional regulator [Trueperaceae bacterium]